MPLWRVPLESVFVNQIEAVIESQVYFTWRCEKWQLYSACVCSQDTCDVIIVNQSVDVTIIVSWKVSTEQTQQVMRRRYIDRSSEELVSCSLSTFTLETKNHRYLFSCICQSQPKTVSAFGLIYGLLKNTNNFTIGSSNFCNTFLMKAISKAKDATHKIINGLSDLQTKLCLFSVCTVHKLTHLFAYDLYTNCSNGLPNNWFCWDGAFNGEFTEMINIIFENITQTSGMPQHSQLIATMSIKQGGLLGLPHPM